MSKKKGSRQKNARVVNRSRRIYPQKQEKKPIDKKAFMRKKKNSKKFSIKRWFINRCEAAVNGIVEDIIRWVMRIFVIWILYNLLHLL